MRIVSALILVTLVAAVYVSRSAPKAEPKSKPPVAAPASPDLASAAAGGGSPAVDGGAGGASELPNSFPAELTSRSGSGSTVIEPVSAVPGADGDQPSIADTEMVRKDLKPSFSLDPTPGDGPAAPDGGEPAAAVGGNSMVGGGVESGTGLQIELGNGPGSTNAINANNSGAGGTEPLRIDLSGLGAGKASAGPSGPAGSPGTQANAASTGPSGLTPPPISLGGSDPLKPINVRRRPSGGDPVTTARPGVATNPVLAPAKPKPGWIAVGTVLRTGGRSLPNVRVRARDRATGAAAGQAMTDDLGAFRLEGIQAAEVALWIDASTLPVGVSALAGTERCRTGSEPLGYGAFHATPTSGAVNIVLPASASVEGILMDGSLPAAGALIRAVSRVPNFDSVKVLASSDGEGFFAMALVPGPYELQVLVPGSGSQPDRARRLLIEAQAGSALMLETLDVRKGTVIGAGDAPVLEQVSDQGASAAPDMPVAPQAPMVRAGEGVEVAGRVISTWGEAVDRFEVVATDPNGNVIRRDWTDALGHYVLPAMPYGEVQLDFAPGLEVGKPSEDGIVLRKRPESKLARSFPGQARVSVEDVVVDVAPVFRLEGRVVVDRDSFEEFKQSLDQQVRLLDDKRLLRAYLRGLKLIQRNSGGKGRPREVEIGADGRFSWSCNLPAEDVVFELRPRSRRSGPGYRGVVGVPVTPAGVRTARVVISYPPDETAAVGGDR